MTKRLTQQVKQARITQRDEAIRNETIVALISCRTITEAAIKLQLDRSSLYDRIKKYQLREFIDSLRQQATDTLLLGASRAAETLVSALDSRNERLEAAKDILDRVGVGKGKENALAVQVNNQQFVIIRGESEKK